MNCTLCESNKLKVFFVEEKGFKRTFHRCSECFLIFQDPESNLSQEEEKKRYDQHQNNPEDEGYREFLSSLVDPMIERVDPEGTGLDFGCGPGPTVSLLFSEKEIKCFNYDPFYKNERKLLERKYNFITSTEVFEHLYNPINEFRLIDEILVQGGYFGMMTVFYHEGIDFSSWWYKNDDTHVCFYSQKTIEYVSQKFNWQIELLGKREVIFKKS